MIPPLPTGLLPKPSDFKIHGPRPLEASPSYETCPLSGDESAPRKISVPVETSLPSAEYSRNVHAPRIDFRRIASSSCMGGKVGTSIETGDYRVDAACGRRKRPWVVSHACGGGVATCESRDAERPRGTSHQISRSARSAALWGSHCRRSGRGSRRAAALQPNRAQRRTC
mmetsp:Transcript_19319/g.58277  ORF Transcript_19319/g.58277 Transcript_19319/m.58277 type:complete len:170 (+) Transcript_19319:435-944(+)